VDTVKLTLIPPAATVTLAGTAATAGLVLESVTTASPAGAGALRVTVPVEAVPPVTLVGLRLKEERVVAGVTVSTAELLAPPYVAEIVTVVEAITELVDTVKSALVVPAATVTLAGTVATLVSVPSATTAPPAGAAPLRITVPVEGLPPTTLVGFRLTEETWGHVIRPVGLQFTPLFVLL